MKSNGIVYYIIKDLFITHGGRAYMNMEGQMEGLLLLLLLLGQNARSGLTFEGEGSLLTTIIKVVQRVFEEII